MRWLNKAIFLASMALLGCSNGPFKSIYEGIRNRNEANKTPSERVMSPRTPSYEEYQKERERLQRNDANIPNSTDKAPVKTDKP